MVTENNIPEPKNNTQYGILGIIVLVTSGIGAIVKLLSGDKDSGPQLNA